MNVDDRKLEVLRAIVEDFISTRPGAPPTLPQGAMRWPRSASSPSPAGLPGVSRAWRS